MGDVGAGRDDEAKNTNRQECAARAPKYLAFGAVPKQLPRYICLRLRAQASLEQVLTHLPTGNYIPSQPAITPLEI
jgi:hypothetical protein